MKGGAAHPVRLKYTKLGKVRWISHRDVARALERAFRVAELPLAFSEGFSPRPRVSFGLALSTGHESEAEFVDLVLADAVDLGALPVRITEALPDGMAVVAAVPLVDRAPALQEAVTSCEWKHRKGRDVIEDIRPVLRGLRVCDTTPVTIAMELSTQPRSAKPGEVLAVIGELTDLRALRTHQWIERDGARREPLDADTRPCVPEARAS
jgi:hypothetical protein